METGKELTKFQVSEDDLIKFLDVFGQSKLSPQEKTQFLQISKAFGLNPFKREIHLIKYGNNFSIVVGYETYIKRAESTGLLKGWSCVTEGDLKDKNSFKAIVRIQRADWKEVFIHEVYLSEYFKDTAIWKEKPITMLKKTAIGQAFRLCFTEYCGGLPYTEEEMQTIQAEVLSSEQPSNLTEMQQKALNLLDTAIGTRNVYDKIKANILNEPDKADKIIEYLQQWQPKEQEQPEVKEPEPEQPKTDEVEKAQELTDKIKNETKKPEQPKDEFMSMEELTGDKPDNVELDKQLGLFDNSKTE